MSIKINDDDDFSEFDEDAKEFAKDISSRVKNDNKLSSKIDFSQSESSIDVDPLDSASSSSSKAKEQKIDNNINIDDDDDDDDDDDLMFDEDEFEMSDLYSSSAKSVPNLKITHVPDRLTGNRWDAYHSEAMMIIVLLIYLTNYFIGRTKNSRLSTIIYNSQCNLLEKNFTLVGDNGQTQNIVKTDDDIQIKQNKGSDDMLKESESCYVIWCSGRVSIESMIIEMRFIKRQCVFNFLASLIKSINDTIVYTVDYGKDDMETFVFCLARKRCATRLHRDMNDLSQFCLERKNAEKKGLNANYQILSEMGEVSSAIIDNRVADFIDKYPDAIEYIHISDQYSGTKIANDNQQSSSNTGVSASQQQDALNKSERSLRRVLIVGFNLITNKDRSLQVTAEFIANDYLRFVLYLIDRVSAFRFTSKESKTKAIKNRQRIEEQFLKNVYQQRQEQAQQKREEKRRAEKEKIMECDDPERQRKWEEKEHKRQLKQRQSKMKQMKIKAM